MGLVWEDTQLSKICFLYCFHNIEQTAPVKNNAKAIYGWTLTMWFKGWSRFPTWAKVSNKPINSFKILIVHCVKDGVRHRGLAC
jgi:hypothetical protein